MTGAGGGVAIAGANMWAVLPDNDPGHSAADAVVYGRKHVKEAAARAEQAAPPADSVAKPATGGGSGSNKATTKETRGEPGDGEQVAPAGAMDDAMLMERFTRIAIAAIYGKQDRVVPEAPPDVPGVHPLFERYIGTGGLPKHQPGGQEEKETTPAAAAPPSEEEEEVIRKEEEEEMVEEEEEFVAVVAKGKVARRARKGKAAVAGRVAVGGTNMWAVLRDDDPGHGAAYGEVQINNEEGKQSDTMDNGEVQSNNGYEEEMEKKTLAALPSKEEEEEHDESEDEEEHDEDMSDEEEDDDDEEEEMSEDEEITSGCRVVAGRICRAAVAVALFALWCRLASPV